MEEIKVNIDTSDRNREIDKLLGMDWTVKE